MESKESAGSIVARNGTTPKPCGSGEKSSGGAAGGSYVAGGSP